MEAENRKSLVFSSIQNRLITASLTLLCCVALAVCVVLALWLFLRGMGYFLHIIGPIIVAFFLSLLTRPWYAWLLRLFRGRVVPTVAVFSLSFLLPTLCVGYFFGAFLVDQSTNLTRALPRLITQTREYLLTLFPDAQALLQNVLPNVAQLLTPEGTISWEKVTMMVGGGMHVGGAVVSAGTATFLWLLTFFYWIAFLIQEPLSGETFAGQLPFLSERGRRVVARYFKNFNDIIVSYFRGQVIDVVIQGILYGVAFQLCGLPNGFFIGFIVGLLNLAPYFGIFTGMCVVLPMAFFHAGFGYMCGILLVVCCIQTFDGYVMQPYIQGNRMKLAAWQIVFALLFWTQLGGFLGLLLAIPLTAFIKAFWREWREYSVQFVGGDKVVSEAELPRSEP